MSVHVKGVDFMKQSVPLAKMSKKAQREFHAKQRGSWNGINPVTRIVPSGKAYKRSATKAETRSIARKASGRHGAVFSAFGRLIKLYYSQLYWWLEGS